MHDAVNSPSTTDLNLPALPGHDATRRLAIPRYLEQVYWWAYVHPRAVQTFEREWLVNAILFGNYARLRDLALAELGEPVSGRTLQVACVYGNLTPRLLRRLAPEARLDVLDILPVQLSNLAKKLPAADERVRLLQGDAAAITAEDASYEQVLMFFLLHEQPEAVRRATLAEALRVLKPGGKLVIVDYHRPVAWHPLRPLMRLIFTKLEPFAIDLWHQELDEFLPPETPALAQTLSQQCVFGGLYQIRVLTRTGECTNRGRSADNGGHVPAPHRSLAPPAAGPGFLDRPDSHGLAPVRPAGRRGGVAAQDLALGDRGRAPDRRAGLGLVR